MSHPQRLLNQGQVEQDIDASTRRNGKRLISLDSVVMAMQYLTGLLSMAQLCHLTCRCRTGEPSVCLEGVFDADLEGFQ